MAAVVPTLVQHFNVPSTADSGTSPKRLAIVYVEVTGTATSNTINLATYVPGLQGIVGVMMNSLDAATITTAPTWSGTTVTLANDGGSHAIKMALLCNF